jgi:hypothetical protein
MSSEFAPDSYAATTLSIRVEDKKIATANMATAGVILGEKGLVIGTGTLDPQTEWLANGFFRPTTSPDRVLVMRVAPDLTDGRLVGELIEISYAEMRRSIEAKTAPIGGGHEAIAEVTRIKRIPNTPEGIAGAVERVLTSR